MKYIFDKKINFSSDAGFKARIDIINILYKSNYNYISIMDRKNMFKNLCCFFKSLINPIEKNSIALFQYPNNINFINILLNKVRKTKSVSICLIHDIDSLRFNLPKDEINREIKLFNKFNYIISHNYKMTSWLEENGVQSTIYELELFDYLSEGKPLNEYYNKQNYDSYTVCYATGILGKEKSRFLYEINKIASEKCRFLLYGGIEEKLKKKMVGVNNVEYMGSLDPNSIAEKIKGDFGLIFDSLHIDNCSGNFSYYTKYNNPHKLSMYIAAGIPVIVWEESAISEFVKINKIGFSINNLLELREKLDNINSDLYNEMKNNVMYIRNKVVLGDYCKKIILKIEKDIEGRNYTT